MTTRLADAGEIVSRHGQKFVDWLRQIESLRENCVEVARNNRDSLVVQIYTAANCYRVEVGPASLTCTCHQRAPLPGTSGSVRVDLCSGSLSEATLYSILAAIVFYEAETVVDDCPCGK